MKTRHFMLATCSLLALAGVSATAAAQDDAATDDEMIETVVVTGIRGSLSESAQAKRDSAQVVDVITAEDVGKLPDNNVPEALAHVTGVQIEREHGEGTSLSIRGMTDIATTLNGNSSSVGEERSMDLSDVPAELLKSVQVYKTRTADQVEGGVGGTVNVDLRRPLDLPDGLTLAGSFRESNSSIGNTWSPYASLLISDRGESSLGDWGFLINASFTQNNYFEDYFYNESEQKYWGTTGASQLAELADKSVVPYKSYFGFEQGSNIRPSVNISTQWAPNDKIDFVLEGSYFSSLQKAHIDKLALYTDNDSYSLSDVTYLDDGQTVKSMTIDNGDTNLPGETESYFNRINQDQFTTNLEAHYHDGRWTVNTALQYNWSTYKYYDFYTLMRFNDLTSAEVDFYSDEIPGGGPYITFNDVDLTDAGEYSLYQYHDEVQISKSHEVISKADASYHISDDWLFRDIKFGTRYSYRHTARSYGYRDAYFYEDTDKSEYMAVSEAPCGDSLQLVSSKVSGSPSWYRISSTCLANNAKEMREFIIDGVSAGNVSSSDDWTTPEPPSNSLAVEFSSNEYTIAGWAQMDWAYKLYFPINGTFGLRIVNTWGDAFNTEFDFDDDWIKTVTETGGKKDYTDMLPNWSVVVHFLDNLQFRFQYSYEISRPDFYISSAWKTVESASSIIYAGNPDLKPMRQNSWDASLEYYFGKGGQLSFGYFLKKPHGWTYYDGQKATSGTYEGYTIYTTRNAEKGTFEGFELTAQSFFDFLPGIWSNFGMSANGTLMTSFNIGYEYLNDIEGLENPYTAEGTSRYTYNLALYYDTPEFSARLAYNHRARWRSAVYTTLPYYSQWNDATSRLDAAINYTPYRYVTFSLEGTNLLKENNHTWWGKDRLIPESTRLQARTIQLSVRFRY